MYSSSLFPPLIILFHSYFAITSPFLLLLSESARFPLFDELCDLLSPLILRRTLQFFLHIVMILFTSLWPRKKGSSTIELK